MTGWSPTDDLPFRGLRVGLAGPMLGVNEGWVTSQHELLAERFAAEGAEVVTTSAEVRRLPRLVDTLRAIRRWRSTVDVVVIAVFSGPGFAVADLTSRAARHYGIPQVLVLHGGELPEFAASHPRVIRACLGRAEAVVAPSAFLASEIRAGVEIGVIPNTFDVDTIPFRPRARLRPRLLWMRTFHPIYNPLLAIEVVQRLLADHPDATLTMGGQSKGMLEECRRRVDELGLTDVVTFVGFLDETAKRAALDSHDVFLNTNDVDNTPVSVLEAAVAGLPIVATEVGGLPHLLQRDEEALLVPPRDPAAMAAAVRRLLSDDELALRLSSNGHAKALESGWPSARAKWAGTFERVVAPSKPHSEQERIAAVYAKYRSSGREDDLWSAEAPGNRTILAERRSHLGELLAGRDLGRGVLEIGCGRGTVLGDLREAVDSPVPILGVDLLFDRLVTANSLGNPVVQADGCRLPFPDGAFDLVATLTVFSSILDPQVRLELAAEILRVLSPKGAVLWYDMRVPSPNRSVRSLRRAGIQELFPGCRLRLESTTLLPPIARRLGDHDQAVYPTLARLPPLRSHLIGTIEI